MRSRASSVARLLQAGAEQKKTRALVLKELLEHHIEEEEEEMFPKVKKSVDSEELEALGVKMQAAFEKAVAKGLDAFFQASIHQLKLGGTNGKPVAQHAHH